MEDSKINSIQQAIFQRKVNENMALIQKYQNEKNQEGLSELQSRFVAEVEAEAATLPPFKFTAEQRQAYKTIGGAPFLDNEYTVFGEVVSGLDIVDKISKTATGANDRPTEDIKIISAKVVK
jgi:cyclophilin family peptidyl-prolyl cis-trans isomerase